MKPIWDPTLLGAFVNEEDGILWRGRWFPPIMGGAEDAGKDGDAGEGADGGTDDGSSGDASGGTDDGSTDDGDDKFTPAQQKKLDKIVSAEKAKAGRGKLDFKELGFNSAKEAADFIAAAKKAEADNLEEGEKLFKEAVDEATAEAKAGVLATANTRLVKAEFLIQASKNDVQYADDAFDLVQKLDAWGDVEIDDDGNVAGIDKALFEELKKAKPFLFTAANGSSDIGAGTRNSGDKRAARVEDLKAKYPSLPGKRSRGIR